MHDKEIAFLEAIREKPDDDTPRLVYADWLEDADEPDSPRDSERAAFIRIQVQLARGTNLGNVPLTIEQRSGLEAEAKTLSWAHRHEWMAFYAPGATDAWFRRGLPERIKMNWHSFQQHSDQRFTRSPIRHLEVRDITDGGVAALAASSHLSRLTTLDLRDNDLGPCGFAAPSESYYAGPSWPENRQLHRP